MADLQTRDQQGLRLLATSWRDRRQLADIRREADLADLADQLAARAQARHAVRAGQLADEFAAILVTTRQRNAVRAAGDLAAELDLSDIQTVLKLGLLHNLSAFTTVERF